MRGAAVRSAVLRAQRPLVARPTSRITTPHPAMIHQPTLLASTKPSRSDPCRDDSTVAPRTAPRGGDPPCRLGGAMPAAPPAWERGMPDIAVFVIGAFTVPQPMPRT